MSPSVRRLVFPQDHGVWAFFLAPLVVGAGAAGEFRWESVGVIVAMSAAFLLRQPVSVCLKIRSENLSRKERFALCVSISLYTAVIAAAAGVLWWRGFTFLGWFVLPAAGVFAFYLWLVLRRNERHQMGFQLIAAAVLSLAAPAAYGVGIGSLTPTGWWLGFLVWLQSAASIVYVYHRLERRRLAGSALDSATQQKRLRPLRQLAWLSCSFNPVFVALLAALGVVFPWLWIPFVLQWGELVWSSRRTLTQKEPSVISIGMRQIGITVAYTALFLLFWGR